MNQGEWEGDPYLSSPLGYQMIRGLPQAPVVPHHRANCITIDMREHQTYVGNRKEVSPAVLPRNPCRSRARRSARAWVRVQLWRREVVVLVYCTGTLDAAIWGAELAVGDGQERIYLVEPTGPLVDDPNLTDKKFPGNPTLSYRSRHPLRVVGEVTNWEGHPPEQLQRMRESLERLKTDGAKIID